jgi:hypothetical protein
MKNRLGVDLNEMKAGRLESREGLGRRVFFRHAGAAFAGSFVLPALRAQAAPTVAGPARNAVFVMLAGGLSHTDTFDLKEGAWTPAAFDPISHGSLRWPRGLMPHLAGHLDDIALLRSVQAPSVVHDPARTAPRFAAVLARELGATPGAFVPLNADSGANGFANACGTARHLLKTDAAVRFVEITMGGWDNHVHIYGTALDARNPHSAARQLDAGLGALIAGLKRDGLFDETLILVMSEFGRTPGPLNARGGRDHFPVLPVLMAGAGIRGGRALGATDATGRRVVDSGWSAGRGMHGGDVEATIRAALGIGEGAPGAYRPITGLWV